MPYTKVNLADLPDQAAGHGLSAHQEARFGRSALDAEQTGFNYLKVKPGQREAFGHTHREAEEIILVLAGAGAVKLNDEIVELTALDAVRVPPGTTRRVEAGENGIELLVFGAHVENDGEMDRDFWAP